jgi:hypothetical protein
MVMKIPASSIARPSKIYPNWYFWFENKPSGNTGSGALAAQARVRPNKNLVQISRN